MIDDARVAKLQRLSGGMDFITKHFAVLSVATAVFGATAAIIFIAAYLRVFDWRIIWIIENMPMSSRSAFSRLRSFRVSHFTYGPARETL
jgi:hypothetical protein